MINETINLIGLGGIGSWVAKGIVHLGCKQLVLIDDDIVEPHNIENQDFEFWQIGRPKVKATDLNILGVVKWYNDRGYPMKIVARQERAGLDSKLRGIVIVVVDSAPARREIFSACRYNFAIPLYIEAGAAENQGAVRVLVPHDKDHVKVYEKLLEAYSDEGQAPCVSTYMSGQFASIIVYWLYRFSDGWRPQTVTETSIDYRDKPIIETEPIL